MIGFAVCLTIVLYPLVAHAYLDPGSVSIVLQAIIGAFVALTVTISVYWQKFLGLFRTKPKNEKKNTTMEKDQDHGH